MYKVKVFAVLSVVVCDPGSSCRGPKSNRWADSTRSTNATPVGLSCLHMRFLYRFLVEGSYCANKRFYAPEVRAFKGTSGTLKQKARFLDLKETIWKPFFCFKVPEIP